MCSGTLSSWALGARFGIGSARLVRAIISLLRAFGPVGLDPDGEADIRLLGNLWRGLTVLPWVAVAGLDVILFSRDNLVSLSSGNTSSQTARPRNESPWGLVSSRCIVARGGR